MAKAIAKVNSHSYASCSHAFVCYFCCMLLLVELHEIYLTEGKLACGVHFNTKCIISQNCILSSSKEPKSITCRRLHLCYLKTHSSILLSRLYGLTFHQKYEHSRLLMTYGIYGLGVDEATLSCNILLVLQIKCYDILVLTLLLLPVYTLFKKITQVLSFIV